jgi:hypothetical protein
MAVQVKSLQYREYNETRSKLLNIKPHHSTAPAVTATAAIPAATESQDKDRTADHKS